MEGNASEQQNVNTAVIVDDVKAPIGIDLGDIRVRWRSFLPGRPTIWHRATLAHLVYTHVTAEKRLADMQAALHAAGQELGVANRRVERQLERDRTLVAENDSLRLAMAALRRELAEAKTRNENQAAMIHAYWTRQASTEHDYQKLVNKLADAEQRIADMEADLAATSADEAEGDQILGDRVEFEDVDTYSELATEAVRLADEVQDLKARQSKGAVWLVIDEETTLAAEEKAWRLASSLREVTTERDKLRAELGLERLKADMEWTRAALAENAAFCANPPMPVTATKVPGWKSLARMFPNTFVRGR